MTEVTEVTEVTTETVEVLEDVPTTTEEVTEVTEVITETIEVTDKPEETTEVTEVTTTETTVIVEEDDVTKDKKPKSKKHRKPKRQPTSGTTEEMTEVTEVTTETVEVLEDVPTTTEEVTEATEVITETIEVTDKPEVTTERTTTDTTVIVEEDDVVKDKKSKSKRHRKSKHLMDQKDVIVSCDKANRVGVDAKPLVALLNCDELFDDDIQTGEINTFTVGSIGNETTNTFDKDGAVIAKIKTDMFSTTKANSSKNIKTIRKTIPAVARSSGGKMRTIDVETMTRTNILSGDRHTEVKTDTSGFTGEVESTPSANTAKSNVKLISFSTDRKSNQDNAVDVTAKTEASCTTEDKEKFITFGGKLTSAIEVQTITVKSSSTAETSTTVKTDSHENAENNLDFITISAVVGTEGTKRSLYNSSVEERLALTATQRTGMGSALYNMKRRRLVKTWLPQFVSYVQRRGRSLSKTMPRKELLNFARDFCDLNFANFEDGFFTSGTYEEKRATWTIARSLSFHYPGVAVQQLGLGFGKFRRTLLIDEVCRTHKRSDGTPLIEVEFVLSALQVVPKKCAYYEDVLILENGEVLFHGTGESLITYFLELGFLCPPNVNVADYLLHLNETQQMYHQVTMIQGFNNQRQLRRSRMFSGLIKYSDDMVLITGCLGACNSSRTSTPVGSPLRNSSTIRLSTSYSPIRRQLKVRGSSQFGSLMHSSTGFMPPQMKITAYSNSNVDLNLSEYSGFASSLGAKVVRDVPKTTVSSQSASSDTGENFVDRDLSVLTTETEIPPVTVPAYPNRQSTKRGSRFSST
ncbi:hypothetical protein Plhal710r2_c033g0120101 [Plasmopara halstedii]